MFFCAGSRSGFLSDKERQADSGEKGDLYEMNMLAYQLTLVSVTSEIEQATGVRPVEAWMGRDLVCVLQRKRI